MNIAKLSPKLERFKSTCSNIDIAKSKAAEVSNTLQSITSKLGNISSTLSSAGNDSVITEINGCLTLSKEGINRVNECIIETMDKLASDCNEVVTLIGDIEDLIGVGEGYAKDIGEKQTEKDSITINENDSDAEKSSKSARIGSLEEEIGELNAKILAVNEAIEINNDEGEAKLDAMQEAMSDLSFGVVGNMVRGGSLGPKSMYECGYKIQYTKPNYKPPEKEKKPKEGNNDDSTKIDEKINEYQAVVEAIESIPDDKYVVESDTEWVEAKEDYVEGVKDECERTQKLVVDTDTEKGGHYEGERNQLTVAEDINDDGKIDENDYKLAKDINGDGKADDEDLIIYRKVHDEGTYTAPDGKVYGYIGDKESDRIGVIHSEQALTDEESGKTVYESKEEREYAGEDPATGFDSLEYSKTETSGDTRKSTWSTSSSINGETIRDEEYSFTLNADGTGEVIASNGAKSRYYYDSEGKMHEEYTGVDKKGNPKQARDTVVDTSSIKTFKITRNGEVVAEYKVNPTSALDQARMRYDIDQARSESNISSGVMDTKDIVYGMTSPDPSSTYTRGIKGTDTNGNGLDYEWSCE